MKSKKLVQKLLLSKTTIADLNTDDLSAIKGGLPPMTKPSEDGSCDAWCTANPAQCTYGCNPSYYSKCW